MEQPTLNTANALTALREFSTCPVISAADDTLYVAGVDGKTTWQRLLRVKGDPDYELEVPDTHIPLPAKSAGELKEFTARAINAIWERSLECSVTNCDQTSVDGREHCGDDLPEAFTCDIFNGAILTDQLGCLTPQQAERIAGALINAARVARSDH